MENFVYMKQFDILKHYFNSLIRSDNKHLCIFTGKTGIGKSEAIRNFCNEIGNYGDKWIMFNGYITTLELYHYLYENQNKIVIFDDVGTLFEDNKKIQIIMSAVYEPRNVMYGTTTEKLKYPACFKFNGKIIILCNKIPKSVPKALLNRAIVYNLEFNHNEMIDFMYAIADKRGYPKEVVDFIRDNSSFYHELNIRILEKIVDYYRFCPENWVQMAINELNCICNRNLGLVYDLLLKYNNVKEQFRAFYELTGKSRRTFYRYKTRLKDISLKDDNGNDTLSPIGTKFGTNEINKSRLHLS